MNENSKILLLFDVDGTLTKSRNKIDSSMISCLTKLKSVADVAYVGGSDYVKISEQLTKQALSFAEYVFSENGLLARRNDQIIGQQKFCDFIGEQKLQKFLNFCLKYLSDIKIPCKRGTFIEFRTGMLNISPIGRNCSQQERDQFQVYDKEHDIRKKFIDILKEQFNDYGLMYSIGGQISFDIVPKGWDKTYCLKFLKDYEEIYFFGDKTFPGGNDHQIYELLKKEDRAFSVSGPEQTISIIENRFLMKN